MNIIISLLIGFEYFRSFNKYKIKTRIALGLFAIIFYFTFPLLVRIILNYLNINADTFEIFKEPFTIITIGIIYLGLWVYNKRKERNIDDDIGHSTTRLALIRLSNKAFIGSVLILIFSVVLIYCSIGFPIDDNMKLIYLSHLSPLVLGLLAIFRLNSNLAKNNNSIILAAYFLTILFLSLCIKSAGIGTIFSQYIITPIYFAIICLLNLIFILNEKQSPNKAMHPSRYHK
jgi:hypothetical protein